MPLLLEKSLFRSDRFYLNKMYILRRTSLKIDFLSKASQIKNY